MAVYSKKSFELVESASDLTQDRELGWIEKDSRGDSGPVQAFSPETKHNAFPGACVESLKALGFSVTGDPFSGSFTGGFNNPITNVVVTKQQSYSRTASYISARGRLNLCLDEIICLASGVAKDLRWSVAKGVGFIHHSEN